MVNSSIFCNPCLQCMLIPFITYKLHCNPLHGILLYNSLIFVLLYMGPPPESSAPQYVVFSMKCYCITSSGILSTFFDEEESLLEPSAAEKKGNGSISVAEKFISCDHVHQRIFSKYPQIHNKYPWIYNKYPLIYIIIYGYI